MAMTKMRNLWFVSSDTGKPPEVVEGLIAASQGAIMPGSIMYRCTAGTWKLGISSAGTDAVHGVIIGPFSAGTANSEFTASTKVRIALITAGQKWAMYVCNNGNDSAIAQTNVGNNYGLYVSAASGYVGYTTLDLNNSNATVQVVNLMADVEGNKFAVTDNPGVALVKFLAAVIAQTKA